MKVLLWSEFYPPYYGGIEKFTRRLALGLADRGHEVSVITSHYDQALPDAEQVDGISIHRFPFHSALMNSDIKAIAKTLSVVAKLKRSLSPDLVHLQLQAPSAFFHLQTDTATPCPTIATVHGEFKDCRAEPDSLLRAVLDRAAWVTSVSHALLDDLHIIAPSTATKSSCIYNGSELLTNSNGPANPDGIIVLGGGRLVREKGLDLLITAFHQVFQAVPNARLVISGDGPERASLKRQAEDLGIAQQLTFLGWITEEALRKQMELATIMVMPSRWREGFGLYALEAALLGLPVIATRVGALPELIEDGRTGLLVPPEDPAALGDAILQLLQSPELRSDLGNAARQSAEARFSFATMLDQYEALYNQLVSH